MTRKEMVALYRTLTNHETNFIEDTPVTDLLNRGAMDFQRKTRILETSTNPPIDVVSATASYPVPADFMETMRVEFKTTAGVFEEIFATKRESLTRERISWRQETGEPEQYFMDAGNTLIVLFPEPDTSIVEGLNIEYKRLANTLLVDSDISILPEEYHEVPVYYAAAIGHMRDGDTNQFRFWMSRYDKEVGEAKIILSRRTKALRLRKRGHIVHPGRIGLNLGSDSPRSF